MKFLISILALFFALDTEAQDSAYYQKVELLLSKIQAKTINESDQKDIKAIAFDLQNRGQILDESTHDYDGSYKLITQAITLFRYLDDTLSIANNLKFNGYLLGKLGR